MPKEYIEREPLEAFFQKHTRLTFQKDDIIAAIANQPAADVAEVKHGKWIDNYNGTSICSVCGGKSPNMNFCGRCGAKMDGKDGEQ